VTAARTILRWAGALSGARGQLAVLAWLLFAATALVVWVWAFAVNHVGRPWTIAAAAVVIVLVALVLSRVLDQSFPDRLAIVAAPTFGVPDHRGTFNVVVDVEVTNDRKADVELSFELTAAKKAVDKDLIPHLELPISPEVRDPPFLARAGRTGPITLTFTVRGRTGILLGGYRPDQPGLKWQFPSGIFVLIVETLEPDGRVELPLPGRWPR
jgi:hypothetical protein